MVLKDKEKHVLLLEKIEWEIISLYYKENDIRGDRA